MNVCLYKACLLCCHEHAKTMCPGFVTCSNCLKCNWKLALELTLLNTIAQKHYPCIYTLSYSLTRSSIWLPASPHYHPHVGQHRIAQDKVVCLKKKTVPWTGQGKGWFLVVGIRIWCPGSILELEWCSLVSWGEPFILILKGGNKIWFFLGIPLWTL